MEKNHLLRIIKDENHCRETSDGKRKKQAVKESFVTTQLGEGSMRMKHFIGNCELGNFHKIKIQPFSNNFNAS